MDIIVFQQHGSAKGKIEGITRYGHGVNLQEIVSIDTELQEFVDDPETYISEEFQADLVLDYLVHPDLSFYLIALCRKKNIPIVATGKKWGGAFTPFTCCGLGRNKALGEYGGQFGFPEYRVQLKGERIEGLEVIRGAPCGATWKVLDHIVGKDIVTAMSLLPREVQYLCTADPSAFDPVTGKSKVHYAGYVHRAALQKAIDEVRKKEKS